MKTSTAPIAYGIWHEPNHNDGDIHGLDKGRWVYDQSVQDIPVLLVGSKEEAELIAEALTPAADEVYHLVSNQIARPTFQARRYRTKKGGRLVSLATAAEILGLDLSEEIGLSHKAIKALMALRNEQAGFYLVTERGGLRSACMSIWYQHAKTHSHLKCREDGHITVRGVGIAEFDELLAAGRIKQETGNRYGLA